MLVQWIFHDILWFSTLALVKNCCAQRIDVLESIQQISRKATTSSDAPGMLYSRSEVDDPWNGTAGCPT